MKELRRAVFLDLNGTLVEPVQVEALDQLALIPTAAQAVRELSEAGFILPVVTTQSRVGRYFSLDEFLAWFGVLRSESLPEIAGVYVCPHRQSDGCSCHKPATELFHQAAQDLSIDFMGSFVIGDTWPDIEAGRRLGVRGCLVRTGWGHLNEIDHDHRAEVVCDDILSAARWILAAVGMDGGPH